MCGGATMTSAGAARLRTTSSRAARPAWRTDPSRFHANPSSPSRCCRPHGRREGPAGGVGSLLVGRRILVGENALGHQIGKLLVAFVAQKERLAAVADEDESVMRNGELVHSETPDKGRAQPKKGAQHIQTEAPSHCAPSNRWPLTLVVLERPTRPPPARQGGA